MQTDGQKKAASREARGVGVRAEEVSKVYRTTEGDYVHALDHVSLDLDCGQFVSLVGPSGCGKSTFLMLVAGLIPLSGGRIEVDGREVKNETHPSIGVVFQNDVLLKWRSVLDNVLLPVEIKKWDRRAYVARAEELLERVGLEGFTDKFPSELSGGMRQRVSICRALVQDPGLLLMDEPFGALDALTREQMNADLQRLWAHVGNTVLFITHSIEEAVLLSDRVIIMSPRPGSIVLDMPVDFPRPRRSEIRSDPDFVEVVGTVRRVFEEQGVLTRD